MNINFKLSATPTILFGVNKLKLLPQLIADFGNKVLIVTGNSSFMKSIIAIDLFQEMELLNLQSRHLPISGEPSPEQIDTAVSQHKNWKPDVVVAIGGGSHWWR
jgi:alcohol dehydrogenase